MIRRYCEDPDWQAIPVPAVVPPMVQVAAGVEVTETGAGTFVLSRGTRVCPVYLRPDHQDCRGLERG